MIKKREGSVSEERGESKAVERRERRSNGAGELSEGVSGIEKAMGAHADKVHPLGKGNKDRGFGLGEVR